MSDEEYRRHEREFAMKWAREHGGQFPCTVFPIVAKGENVKTEIDRSAIGSRNRRRGNDVQREYARYNCAIWDVDPEKHAIWTGRNIDGHSDNIYINCPGAGYHVEVKGEKELRPHAYMRQTLTDAPDEQCWCAFRRPGALQRLFRDLFYVLVPMPTFTDVRGRAGCHFESVHVASYTGRTNWLLKEWIPEVERDFAVDSTISWMILLELNEDEVEEHDWPRAIALTSGRTWAELLMRAWERTGTTSV